MPLQKIPFRNTHAFTAFFLKYIEKEPALQSFYSRFPAPANFKEQLAAKMTFTSSSRTVLVNTLQRQYAKLSPPDAVKGNIHSLLNTNSFTVVTGHQLNIFTGPLYFIYKIVTAINACKKLKAQYPDHNFIPVYWMATEDHDYEEIKSFRLYGKKYTWETQQQGAVGRFTLKELSSLIDTLPGDVSVFTEAYAKNTTLGDAVRQYVTRLFGHEGVVVLDADDRHLKKSFRHVMKADLIDHTPLQCVEETNAALKTSGFQPEVNPREINFFYLDKNLRSRIERSGDDFIVVDTDLKFSESQIGKMIEEEPEKFSPNVILRPLFQEIILPNLAYVGGPSELLYWLQLKSLFTHFQTPFPILLPRNFAMIIDAATGRKLARTGLNVQDFFEEKNYLFNHWVSKNSTHDLSLGNAMASLAQLLKEIQRRGEKIDTTLAPMIQAEATRMQSALETIEKKMLRAEKRHQADKLRQIETIKDVLFPNGNLQERTDNFLNFYQQDTDFINKLVNQFDPFAFQFNVLSYHD